MPGRNESARIYIPYWAWSADGFTSGWDVYTGKTDDVAKHVRRLVLLNAVVPYNGFMHLQRVDIDTAAAIVATARKLGKPIESYIGHPATAAVLSKVLGIEVPVNRGMYQPRPSEQDQKTLRRVYDIALVFRLKKRLAKPGDVENVAPDDLEIWLVWYL